MTTGPGSHPTHVAYADESNYNTGRFRAIALVSLKWDDACSLSAELSKLLQECRLDEFKWSQLKSSRERIAALKMIDCAIKRAAEGGLRLDVLLWDITDSRHNIRGRDDMANLQRLYWRLLENVMTRRWPDRSSWLLRPDEQSGVAWGQVQEFLDAASTRLEVEPPLFCDRSAILTMRTVFNIEKIEPCRSQEEPLVQLADLHAGLAVYSRTAYDRFDYWRRSCAESRQLSLLPEVDKLDANLSRRDIERCFVLAKYDEKCKSRRLGVSLATYRGLYTPNPANPINFWLYEPQHEADKAPTREA